MIPSNFFFPLLFRVGEKGKKKLRHQGKNQIKFRFSFSKTRSEKFNQNNLINITSNLLLEKVRFYRVTLSFKVPPRP